MSMSSAALSKALKNTIQKHTQSSSVPITSTIRLLAELNRGKLTILLNHQSSIISTRHFFTTYQQTRAPTMTHTELPKITGHAEFSAPRSPGVMNFPQWSSDATKTIAELIQDNHDRVSSRPITLNSNPLSIAKKEAAPFIHR